MAVDNGGYLTDPNGQLKLVGDNEKTEQNYMFQSLFLRKVYLTSNRLERIIFVPISKQLFYPHQAAKNLTKL